jgi:hypothetical protein
MLSKKKEYTTRRSIVVSLDSVSRKTADGIEILPWKIFLKQLWDGKVM